MPGGGKKAVFPPLHLHDHDQIRMSTNDHDRQKKFLQNRGKSLELKESLDKNEGSTKTKNKCQSGASKSTDKVQNGKSDLQKTPTKSEQKAMLKLEQQQIKSEQKAQQKLEKEQQKLEKEHQKEQMKLEKEQRQSQSKINLKGQERTKPFDQFSSVREGPQLKTQKSIDLSCLKYMKSVESSSKHPARKSVDMQYKQDLLDPANFASSFSSIQIKPKK